MKITVLQCLRVVRGQSRIPLRISYAARPQRISRRIPVIAIVLTFFLFSLSSAALAEPAELVYVPLPLEAEETVVVNNIPMVRYLSEKLGVPVRIRYEKDYQYILQLVQEGKVDLVQLGPLPYAALKRRYPQVQPLAVINEHGGDAEYSCVLVSSIDGPQSIAEIRGPLALTQPLSTCGHFSATLLFAHKKPDLEQSGYHYLGNHDNVALAVIRAEFEAGIIKRQVAEKYHGFALRILGETPPLPGFMLIGNTKTLSPEQISQIGHLLIEVDSTTRSSWITGKDGFSSPSGKNFDLLDHYAETHGL